MAYGLWTDRLFQETAILLMGSLFILSMIFYLFFSKKGPVLSSAWASIRSYLISVPFIFAVLALPAPWPLVFLVGMCILSAKTFFQMVGAYHRSYFVWITYIFIILQGYLIHEGKDAFFDLTPMMFLGVISFIPLIRNSATHMIQYMALSLLCFLFFGWSLLHLGRFAVMDGGILILIYLVLLTEVSDYLCWAISRTFGKIKVFSKISNKVTLEGFLITLIVTVFLAWGMRHLLPARSQQYWLAAGLVAAMFGQFGGLILSVIRRDLGIKSSGIFIFGRDDILARVDKLIFVAPLYYYLYFYFQQGAQ